jgi:hypothetical protein
MRQNLAVLTEHGGRYDDQQSSTSAPDDVSAAVVGEHTESGNKIRAAETVIPSGKSPNPL